MRLLGLDIGSKTIGVAISDKTNTICSPLMVIRFTVPEDAIKKVMEIVTHNEISDIVIGLPKNMNNTEGFASNRSINFKSELEQVTDVNIHLVDERLTTIEARNILITSNYSRKRRKENIDSVAAVLILESYLNRKGNKDDQR